MPAAPATALAHLPAPEARAWTNPWEQRGGRGWFAALGETLQESLLRPGAFFRGTDPGGGIGPALLFAAAVGTLSMAVVLLWQHALSTQVGLIFGDRLLELRRLRAGWAGPVLAAPFGMIFNVLLWSAIFHLGLKVVGSGGGGFGATVKAVAYSCSAIALTAVPVAGWAAWLAWMAVLQVVGFLELHRTSGARALLGWSLPIAAALLLAAAVVGAITAVLLRFWQVLGGRFEV